MIYIGLIFLAYILYASRRYYNILPFSSFKYRIKQALRSSSESSDLALPVIVAAIVNFSSTGQFLQAKKLIQAHLLQSRDKKMRSQGYYLLGNCYRAVSLYDDAIVHYELAIKQDENIEAVKALLALHSRTQNWLEQAAICKRYNFDPSIQSYAFHAAIELGTPLPSYLDTVYQYHPLISQEAPSYSLQYWPIAALFHLEIPIAELLEHQSAEKITKLRLCVFFERCLNTPTLAYEYLKKEPTVFEFLKCESITELQAFARSFLALHQNQAKIVCQNCQHQQARYTPYCGNCGSCETWSEIKHHSFVEIA